MYRSSGASRDSLKREFEVLKETEQELRKRVGRLFRRRRGFSIQRIAEFFTPTNADKMRGGMRRRWTLNPRRRRRLSTGDPQPPIPEEVVEEGRQPGSVREHVEPPLRQRSQTISTVRHSQTASDIMEHHSQLDHREEDRDSSSPGLTLSGLNLTQYSHTALQLCTLFCRDACAWRGGATPISIPLYTHLLHPGASFSLPFP